MNTGRYLDEAGEGIIWPGNDEQRTEVFAPFADSYLFYVYRPVSPAAGYDSAWHYPADSGAGLFDYGLFCSGRRGSGADQCRCSDPDEHRHCLFSRHGYDGTYHNLCLSDVWIFPFWQEPAEYMGDSGRSLSLCLVSQNTGAEICIYRPLWDQPVAHYYRDDVRRQSAPGWAHSDCPGGGLRDRIFPAASGYQRAFCPQGLFPVQCRVCLGNYRHGNCVADQILWIRGRVAPDLGDGI